MDSLLGISSSTPLVVGTSGAVNQASNLLASELSLSTTPLAYGNTSSVVDLSGVSQLLSAATTFQDQLQSLQPGTATATGGQNFGTDVTSFAAEVQNFVDAFNGVQSNIANINTTSVLLGGNVAAASSLTQSLNAQAVASYGNGGSTLTSLSQLGIEFQPSPLPGGGGSLSVNQNTLQSAFNSNPAQAFSLLSQAANAFSGVAAGFVGQAGNQNSSLFTSAQTSAEVAMIANSLLSQAQSNGDVSSLLAIESLTGVASLQQVLLALNEYSFVSSLTG